MADSGESVRFHAILVKSLYRSILRDAIKDPSEWIPILYAEPDLQRSRPAFRSLADLLGSSRNPEVQGWGGGRGGGGGKGVWGLKSNNPGTLGSFWDLE
jgi:hypothetical protein